MSKEGGTGGARDQSELSALLSALKSEKSSSDQREAEHLLARYHRTFDLVHLDGAIRVLERVVLEDLSAGEQREWTYNLALALYIRHARMGDAWDLQRATELLRRLVAVTPEGAPDRGRLLGLAGSLLLENHQINGVVDLLAEAIDLLEKATRDPGDASMAQLAKLYSDLGSALANRHELLGAEADLDAGIAALERSTTFVGPGYQDWPMLLNNMAAAIDRRFFLRGERTDRERALDLWKQASAATAPESPNQWTFLLNLSLGLRERYRAEGRLQDLEESIALVRQAQARAPARPIARAGCFNGLGTALSYRFARTGSLADLDEALEAWRQAVAELPTGAPSRLLVINNLASGLRGRFERFGAVADLDEAIRLWRLVLTEVPPDSSDLNLFLGNLAHGLTRHSQERLRDTVGQRVDLDEAIGLWQRARSRLEPGTTEATVILHGLSLGLSARYDLTGNLKDLRASVRCAEEALERLPADSPWLHIYTLNLAYGLRELYRTKPSEDLLQRTGGLFRQAVSVDLDGAREATLLHALRWGEFSFERRSWAEAVEAYGYARQVSDRLFAVQPTRRGKEAWLGQAPELAANAAFALARTGDLEGAVLALEQIRVRLLNEALGHDRARLAALASREPGPYERYRQAAEALLRLESAEGGAGAAPPIQARAARSDMDELVGAIRRVEGFEDLFRAPSFADVETAVEVLGERGAVVYLATTRLGSIALILTPGTIEEVWLSFCHSSLQRLLVEVEKGGYLQALFDRERLERVLPRVLQGVGRGLLAPVADRLRRLKVEHVVLIPVGRLAILPLSAVQVRKGEDHFIDEFDVSFSFTATALTGAKRELDLRRAEPLLVGVGDSSRRQPLRTARQELERITSLFPADAHHLLSGVGANRQALLPLLAEATHLHFACHGLFDPETPLTSRLELAGNEALTLHDLLYEEARPGHARLAFLSACQTALSDFRRLPDEAVGLPAGFVQAGVPGVIGTLWPVADVATMLLANRFYHEYLTEGCKPAKALARAQRWLRSQTAEVLGLADIYTNLYEASGGRDAQAYVAARHYQKRPDSIPFIHPQYWAPFVLYGL